MAAGMEAGTKAVLAFQLQALVTQIAHPGIGIFADQDTGANVAPGILLKMAADGQIAHIHLVAGYHNLLHRS